LQAFVPKLLKKDVFGETWLQGHRDGRTILRDARPARRGVRWLARRLLRREARALAILDGLAGVPRLFRAGARTLEREYLYGTPMHEARPTDRRYFREALRTVRRMHRKGVVHNDLAKEPNFLVTEGGKPAIVDFQIALYSPGRGPVFRLLAREDVRHLLKHKRTYCPNLLTERQKRMLASPALPARLWMATGKPVYLFVTRRILGWRDREGAGDRN